VEVSTKERLTGALILVLALVVIAPEMLSGRRAPERGTAVAQNPEDGAPLQTYSIRLDDPGPSQVSARDTAAVAVEEVAAVPPPATGDAPEPASVPVPAPKPAAAAGKATQMVQPVSSAEKPGATASGTWWVQVGSFGSRENAQRLAAKLRDAGYAMQVSQGRQNGKDLFRVRAGPVADRAAAQELRTRLMGSGQKNPQLIAP
jgi:DedD protein